MSDRIEASFSVDVPTAEIAALHDKLARLHPGTIAYCETWDELASLHKAFLTRLEGEALAYMNIAKERTKKIFFPSQG
ncbi:MAG: hypothetical protein AB7L09_03120 [Nitrospira sp.]